MPDLSLLEGAGILLSGMLAGRFWPARRKGPRPPKPVCGCRHHASYHEAGTGPCHFNEHYAGYCRCRQYTGPQPLPEFYAPEIT
jgi:hypothetical protein